MSGNYQCGCGQKTKNPSGICDKCLEKVRFLNRIREIVGITPKQRKKKTKYKYETYLAFKPNRGYKDGKEQLCWYCEKACGRCSWSRSFTPIEGWEAEPTTVRNRDTAQRTTATYYIKACPEYEPLKMRRKVQSFE